MNIFKKIYYRIYQSTLKTVKSFLSYREPEILTSIQDLPYILREDNIEKVLIVTDKNIQKVGLVKNLENELVKTNIKFSVYDKTVSDPTIENALEAAIKYLETDSQALVALGGGSVIDCAKAARSKLENPSKKFKKRKGLFKVSRKIPPLIAIPTTFGSGSESTPTADLIDQSNKDIITINDLTLIPNIAVLDPEMTDNLPKELIAITGMDALAHAIEAYIGNNTDIESKRSAQEAIEIIFNNLVKAYLTGDKDVRDELLFASFLAGRSYSKSYVGYTHALAHACEGIYRTANGLANAIFLPVVLEKYRPHVDSKLHELAVLIELADFNEPISVGAFKFIEAVKLLNKTLGIPEKLEDLQEEDIPDLSYHTLHEANPFYPVPVILEDKDIETILSEVIELN